MAHTHIGYSCMGGGGGVYGHVYIMIYGLLLYGKSVYDDKEDIGWLMMIMFGYW